MAARGLRREPANRLAFAILGGVDVASAESMQVSGVGRVDVSLGLPHRLVGRASISAGMGTRSSEPTEHRRRQVLGRLDLGMRLVRDGYWLQPGASLGAAVSRIAAIVPVDMNLGEQATTRVHPVLGALTSAGARLGERIWFRADVDLSFYPIADRYLVEPLGEIARSPRVSAFLLAGIEWEL